MNTIVLIIGALAGAAIMWGLSQFFGFFAPKKETRSSTAFSEAVKANEMISLRYYFQRIIENKQINLWVFESKILLICKGKIEYRFDMSKVKLEPDEENKRVRIKMPVCDILPIIEAKEEDVRVYDATRGVYDYIADFFRDEPTYGFNKVIAIIEQEKPEIIKEARENLHLEELAQANARCVLENLAKTFGYTADIFFEGDNNTISNNLVSVS